MTLDIESMLRGAGLSDLPGEYDSDIHSWRCGHPDIYGPCSCFQDLVADLREQIAAWLGSDEAETAAAAGVEEYAYPGLSSSECEQTARHALSALAALVTPSRVGGES